MLIESLVLLSVPILLGFCSFLWIAFDVTLRLCILKCPFGLC